MTVTVNSPYGDINIDKGVIASVASRAAMESYGIVGLAYINAKDGFMELIRKDGNISKGVKVTLVENEICIDLAVVLEYGVSISVVGQNIIDTVKFNVENTTGIKVSKINIVVHGVRVETRGE